MSNESDASKLELESSSNNEEIKVAERRRIRHGQCEVCNARDARYSCPKCEVKTCSVPCVQIHKKELDCNGIRDRTKYIPLRQMTKTDFMSDYYFLEETTRYVQTRQKDSIKNYTRYNKFLPPRLFALRKAAAERKTTLRFLLMNFTRHKTNTSFYDWNLKRIYWRVEWIFVNACNAKYASERCDEEQKLYMLLAQYVGDQQSGKACLKGLEYYESVGTFGLKVLLKAEGIKRCSERFYALDCTLSLRENLANKTIVEFPCIYVTYEQELMGLDVIDSDEDVIDDAKKHEIKFENLGRELRKQNWRKENNATTSSDNDDDAEKLRKLLREKRREERKRKREEFEKEPSNYLFADEKLWDILSSSSSEAENGNITEEEEAV